MAELDVQLKQVLKRFPPGDRWTPVDAEQPIFSSLTEGIEWVFQSTQKHDFVIKAAEGKVFTYQEFEIAEPEPEPPNVLKKSQVSNTVDKCCTPKTIKE